MSRIFISDLHLEEARPDITSAFERFLSQRANEVKELYILGDFFEVWLGDDDLSDFNVHIAACLRRYTESGHKVFLMVGNRDFLLGEAFAQSCNATLLADPTQIRVADKPTLLMHGDSLCTGDSEYMAFRQMSRSPEWQQHMLSRTLEERRAFARQVRAQSQNANSMKAEDIMDVTPAEVINTMESYQVTQLIHGHTHRPARHPVTTQDADAERIVLGDWDTQCWWLRESDAGDLELQHCPLSDV